MAIKGPELPSFGQLRQGCEFEASLGHTVLSQLWVLWRLKVLKIEIIERELGVFVLFFSCILD